MSLPKIAVPTFTCKLPSTGEDITYRPILVKEEKILLMAKETRENLEIYRALRQIINNCVQNDGFNVDKCTLADMDYLFIKLRAKSVGEIVHFTVVDSTDKLEYNLVVNLDEVEVISGNTSNVIKIDDKYSMVMKYPTPLVSEKLEKMTSIAEMNFEMIKSCIDYIYDEDDIYPWGQSSDDEQDEFLEALPQSAYEKIDQFFKNVPRIEHVVKYTNSLGQEKKVVFRSLDDFFTLV